MNNCSNCYNGCSTITSDQCIKYTGTDIPLLGIQKGDSLSYVQQAILGFLVSTLNGQGIIVTIPTEEICELVSKYLPTCKDISIVDVATATIKGLCEVQETITDNSEAIAVINYILTTLNANYTVHCLEGVTASSDTHDIVQAAINKLCSFITTADSTYVKQTEVCNLVQACLNQQGGDKAYSKMVPYTIVEYFGSLSNYPASGDSFDGTGAGQGYWEKVYLCNGLNGTPDKRGVVSIGVTDGSIGGAAMSATVDPAASIFNPTYMKGIPFYGANSATLSETQMPAHSHTATATSIVTEPNDGQGHRHTVAYNSDLDSGSSSNEIHDFRLENTTPPAVNTGYATTGITVTTSVVNQSTGGGLPFSLTQPAIGAVYIMYIP